MPGPRRSVLGDARPLLAAALLLALLAACGGPDPSGPPEIRYGIDVCDHCRMIISDERYAAARWDAETMQHRRYDDVGCLLDDRPESVPAGEAEPAAEPGAVGAGSDEPVRARWVHDHGEPRWIPAEEAAYVLAPGLETPMGSGLAAFGERAAAERFAAGLEESEVLGWGELLARSAGDAPAGTV